MKAQVDAALGINNAVLSVADAVKAIEDLIKPKNSSTGSSSTSGTAKAGGPSWGGSGAGGGNSSVVVEQKTSTVDPTTGVRTYSDGSTQQMTPEELWAWQLTQKPGWIPSYDIGTNRVPRDMLAMVHKDEAIIPAAYNPFNPEAIMPLTNVGGKSGVAAVSNTDSSLVERVNNLEIVLQVIAVNTSKVARILDSAQGEDGRSIMTAST